MASKRGYELTAVDSNGNTQRNFSRHRRAAQNWLDTFSRDCEAHVVTVKSGKQKARRGQANRIRIPVVLR